MNLIVVAVVVVPVAVLLFRLFSVFMFLCRALVSLVVVVAVVRVCCCCCCLCCGHSPHVGSNIISFCLTLKQQQRDVTAAQLLLLFQLLSSFWQMVCSWAKGRSTRLCYMCLAHTFEGCPISYYLLSANYAIELQPGRIINSFVCLQQEPPRLT